MRLPRPPPPPQPLSPSEISPDLGLGTVFLGHRRADDDRRSRGENRFGKSAPLTRSTDSVGRVSLSLQKSTEIAFGGGKRRGRRGGVESFKVSTKAAHPVAVISSKPQSQCGHPSEWATASIRRFPYLTDCDLAGHITVVSPLSLPRCSSERCNEQTHRRSVSTASIARAEKESEGRRGGDGWQTFGGKTRSVAFSSACHGISTITVGIFLSFQSGNLTL